MLADESPTQILIRTLAIVDCDISIIIKSRSPYLSFGGHSPGLAFNWRNLGRTFLDMLRDQGSLQLLPF